MARATIAAAMLAERKLPSKRKHFERGRKDTFTLPAFELGDLVRLVVRHDGTGMGAGWHLDRIDVWSELSGRGWSFPCGQWLDKSEGDGLIERELQAEALVVEPEPEAEPEPVAEAGRQK